jgi:hypothetical protein
VVEGRRSDIAGLLVRSSVKAICSSGRPASPSRRDAQGQPGVVVEPQAIAVAPLVLRLQVHDLAVARGDAAALAQARAVVGSLPASTNFSAGFQRPAASPS